MTTDEAPFYLSHSELTRDELYDRPHGLGGRDIEGTVTIVDGCRIQTSMRGWEQQHVDGCRLIVLSGAATGAICKVTAKPNVLMTQHLYLATPIALELGDRVMVLPLNVDGLEY